MQMAIGLMKTGLYDGPRLKVLMYMAWRHDHVSGFAWPSMERIAQEVGLTERGVRKIMQYLEETGVVIAERGNGRGHLTRYRFPSLATEKGERPALLSQEKGGTETTERGNGKHPQ